MMPRTMEIFKAVMVVALVLVPLIGAASIEELNEKLERKNGKLEVEVAQLKELVNALQKHIKTLEVEFRFKQNDTEELEARVAVLEESVADLEVDVVALTDEVDDVESANLLQDDRINTLEAEVFDNENDIEELVDVTSGLTGQVLALDQRVDDLESGGGNVNVTDLTERVVVLEELTSQLTDDVSSLEVNDVTQDERISSIEEDVTSLDQRVEDLEAGGGGSGNITDYGDTIFLAALSATDTSSGTLVFDWEVINHGGHYNPETGRYTVPYKGIYQFSVHLTVSSITSNIYFFLYVDGSQAGSHRDIHSGDVIYRSTTVLLELQAGQEVSVYRGSADVNGASTELRSYVSGYMISAN